MEVENRKFRSVFKCFRRFLIDCFEEKFLYPLECREVPSGS